MQNEPAAAEKVSVEKEVEVVEVEQKPEDPVVIETPEPTTAQSPVEVEPEKKSVESEVVAEKTEEKESPKPLAVDLKSFKGNSSSSFSISEFVEDKKEEEVKEEDVAEESATEHTAAPIDEAELNRHGKNWPIRPRKKGTIPCFL